MPAHRALCKDVGLCSGISLHRPGNHLFRVPQPIDGGRVDPVDSQVNGSMDGGNGLIIVLRTPGEGPVAAAYGPGAKADGSESKVGVAKSAKGERIGRCHSLKIDDLDELQASKIENIDGPVTPGPRPGVAAVSLFLSGCADREERPRHTRRETTLTSKIPFMVLEKEVE